MRDLQIAISQILSWFPHEKDSPYVLVRVPEEQAATWVDLLSIPVRQCYVDDSLLNAHAERTGFPKAEVLAARFPDRGSTMAGDFGEILVYLYQAASEHPAVLVGPKKWRLKADRTKPVQGSDVVQFIVPSWPVPSSQDCLLCAEVKTKSTAGDFSPITDAIEDCEKDRTGRLAKTMLWLKERALSEDLGSVSIAHLDRFIRAIDHPPALKRFRAIAVVCASLVEDEIIDAPDEAPSDYTVVVIAVPNLKKRYQEVFDAALGTVANSGAT